MLMNAFSIFRWKLSGKSDQRCTSTSMGSVLDRIASRRSETPLTDCAKWTGFCTTRSRSLPSCAPPVTRLPYAHTSASGRFSRNKSVNCSKESTTLAKALKAFSALRISLPAVSRDSSKDLIAALRYKSKKCLVRG